MVVFSRKRIVYILAFVGCLLLLQSIYYTWQVIAIGAAYKAKILCSGVFISNRDPREIMGEDLESILGMIDAKVDFATRSVSASFPGVPSQHAIFREQRGCTLLAGASDAELRESGGAHPIALSLPVPQKKSTSVQTIPQLKNLPDASREKIAQALDKAFSEKDRKNPVKTRAVIVQYDGRTIAERYAPGFSASTPLSGWSLAKSAMNALVGILVYEGKLSIDRPVAIAEWSGHEDKRKIITLDHLLRMNSGLKFDETNGPFVSDVNVMLLRSRDTAAYALARPLKYDPGTHWQYSSGTTNIISRIIRDCMGGKGADYQSFPHQSLFDKIGMANAVLESDEAGNFVGSSFMYATARDWARFGQLYLQDGIWEDKRILPEGWVAYSTRPTPTATERPYGAHFWLNRRNSTDSKGYPFEKLPPDLFYASGFEGQYVVIIPSRKLVVVRLGMTKNGKAWDMEAFISDILEAIPILEAVPPDKDKSSESASWVNRLKSRIEQKIKQQIKRD
jgi:CubicO group peptidase (beta-lactamase class C family)